MKRSWPTLGAVLLAALCAMGVLCTAALAAQTRYVAPGGSDTNDGSAAAPLATIGKALAVSQPGDTIQLAAGSYPLVDDRVSRSGTVTISGAGAGQSLIAGAHLYGSRYLRFTDVGFTDSVVIASEPVLKAAQPAAHLSFDHVDMTTGNTTTPAQQICLTIRDGADDVTLSHSHVHACGSGIVTPPTAYQETNIHILDNVIEDFPGDAIQFTDWADAVIAGNTIQHMRDPAGSFHNDAIQFVGNSQRIRITGNRLLDSQGQLILVQDARDGINSDLTIDNNLIAGADDIAVQIAGAPRVSFINNTVWGNGLGGVIVRYSPYTNTVTHDTVVVNNIIDRLSTAEGSTIGVQRRNLLLATAADPGTEDLLGVSPDFVSVDGQDYVPAETSPVVGSADPAYAPSVDLKGTSRSDAPSIGALEPAGVGAGTTTTTTDTGTTTTDSGTTSDTGTTTTTTDPAPTTTTTTTTTDTGTTTTTTSPGPPAKSSSGHGSSGKKPPAITASLAPCSESPRTRATTASRRKHASRSRKRHRTTSHGKHRGRHAKHGAKHRKHRRQRMTEDCRSVATHSTSHASRRHRHSTARAHHHGTKRHHHRGHVRTR